MKAEWVLETIRDELRAFLASESRRYFEDDFEPLQQAISADVHYLDDDKKETSTPAFLLIEDFAIQSEVGGFYDDLKDWLRDVEEIRSAWLWDHLEVKLPEDFLSVFGYTSDVVRKLERIKSAGVRILLYLDKVCANQNTILDVGKEKILRTEFIEVLQETDYPKANQTMIKRMIDNGTLPKPHEDPHQLRHTFFYVDELNEKFRKLIQIFKQRKKHKKR